MTEPCELCGKTDGTLSDHQDGFAMMRAHEVCVLRRDNLRLVDRCDELEQANKRLMSKLYT